jgi:hypothetical protein
LATHRFGASRRNSLLLTIHGVARAKKLAEGYMVKTKRSYSDATVPYVPEDELDIMAALLREKLPPARLGKSKSRKRKKRRGAK